MNIFIASYKIKSFFTKTNQFLSFIHPKAPKLHFFNPYIYDNTTSNHNTLKSDM